MNYILGAKSLQELQGVHPKLVALAQAAIQTTSVDFSVFDGLRTLEEQLEYVKTGVSKTLNSKHLQQVDGYGHAMDLVPYINGKDRWEWEPIYKIAACIREAAIAQGVKITWGGVWDRCLNDLIGDLKLHVSAYASRHPGPDFLDGPHFQLAEEI